VPPLIIFQIGNDQISLLICDYPAGTIMSAHILHEWG